MKKDPRPCQRSMLALVNPFLEDPLLEFHFSEGNTEIVQVILWPSFVLDAEPPCLKDRFVETLQTVNFCSFLLHAVRHVVLPSLPPVPHCAVYPVREGQLLRSSVRLQNFQPFLPRSEGRRQMSVCPMLQSRCGSCSCFCLQNS